MRYLPKVVHCLYSMPWHGIKCPDKVEWMLWSLQDATFSDFVLSSKSNLKTSELWIKALFVINILSTKSWKHEPWKYWICSFVLHLFISSQFIDVDLEEKETQRKFQRDVAMMRMLSEGNQKMNNSNAETKSLSRSSITSTVAMAVRTFQPT